MRELCLHQKMYLMSEKRKKAADCGRSLALMELNSNCVDLMKKMLFCSKSETMKYGCVIIIPLSSDMLL